MAGCTVNSEASPQFKKLRANWKRSYPKITEDLEKAFSSISKDILANHAARIQAGPNLEVYKYRQNSKDIGRGASYGWRIIALFDKPTGVMYPILVYPKTAWADAGNDAVTEAIKQLLQILGHCIVPGCEGTMAESSPPDRKSEGNETHTKMKCSACGAIQWVVATEGPY